MPVGKVSIQTEALQLFGTGGVNEADIRWKVMPLSEEGLTDMVNSEKNAKAVEQNLP